MLASTRSFSSRIFFCNLSLYSTGPSFQVSMLECGVSRNGGLDPKRISYGDRPVEECFVVW